MKPRRLGALGLTAALAACTAPGEAGRPAQVVAAIGKVVETLATEAAQRQASDAFRGLPIVVKTAAASGAEVVIAEMVRTRLTERGAPLEVACPAKCLEVTLVEFVAEASAQVSPGQVLPVNANAVAGLSGLPGARSDRGILASGQASVLLVTFAARDGNRYTVRQQAAAIVAIARAADAR